MMTKEEIYFVIKNYYSDIIVAFGLKLDDQHYKGTPHRIASMFTDEIFSGLFSEEPKLKAFDTKNDEYDQMIIVKEIPFYSMCCHHFLPFFGTVAVGYIPDKKIAGLSKFSRVVDYFAKRPQIQEKLTEEITGFIYEKLQPLGCGCVIKARHLCMEMRGVNRSNEFTTTGLKGNFLESPSVKNEFLNGAKR